MQANNLKWIILSAIVIYILGISTGVAIGYRKALSKKELNLRCGIIATPLTNPFDSDIFMTLTLSCRPTGDYLKERINNDVQTG